MNMNELLRYVSLAKFYVSSGKRSECVAYLIEIERQLRRLQKVIPREHTYFHKR